jgi:DNA-binding MarR family transcriptional regulator
MPNPDRPQAPGYLANLMARLFHEVAGEGLVPLGIAPPMFPLLVELWFGDAPVSRESLRTSQEMDAGDVDALVLAMAEAGLIERSPAEAGDALVLTAAGEAAKGPAVVAARRANAAAAGALSEDEMAAFMGMMNRVIDALQEAKG